MKDSYNIPLEIVHLKELDAMIIPLDMDEESFIEMTEEALSKETITTQDFSNNVRLMWGVNNATKDVIDYLNRNVSSFVVFHERYFGDVDVFCGDPILFHNGLKVDFKGVGRSFFELFDIKKCSLDTNNEEIYHSYYSVQKEYFKRISLHLPVNWNRPIS